MYWLVLSTFFWGWSFGNYATLEECEKAAESAPWYTTTACVPLPKQPDAVPHTH